MSIGGEGPDPKPGLSFDDSRKCVVCVLLMSGAQFKAGAVPLSEMGDFAFWSREAIGATPEDYEAAINGSLSPERQEQLAVASLQAREALAEMPVPGFQDWMPPRRRVN